MIKQLEPVDIPVDFAEWIHPDLFLIDPRLQDSCESGYTDDEWKKMQLDGGIAIQTEKHCIEDIAQIIGDDDLEDWSGWNPNPPTPDHFLICAHSTEYDFIVLWWAKKLKLNSKPINAVEFVKNNGWDKAKHIATKYFDYTHVTGDARTLVDEKNTEFSIDDLVSIHELKRLVESYESVEQCGGLDEIKKHFKDGCYVGNEKVLVRQSITDVESCQ